MKRVHLLLAVSLCASLQAQTTRTISSGAGAAPSSAEDGIISDKSFKTPVDLDVTPESDEWTFTLEPYLWATALTGNVGIKGFGPVHTSMNAKSVLQNLDWAVMARGEIRKGRLGLPGDGMFSQLSAAGDPPGPLYDSAHARVQQGMASLALSYRLLEGRQGFIDVYAGARFNYLGINLGGSPDSSGIRRVSDSIAQRVAGSLKDRADAYISANSTAIESAVAEDLGRAVRSNSDLRQSFDGSQVGSIVSGLQKNSGAYRELVSATAEMRLAEARQNVTEKIEQRLEKAKDKFSKELAKKIEDKLPTSADGEQWWVDPIVGLRAQVNLTRSLFLAAQGDVGGFGAGSDLAALAQATVGVNITRHVFAELGYRYFYMDYAGSGAVYDAAEYGIFSGIGVTF